MMKIGLTMSIEQKGTVKEYSIPSDYIDAVYESGAIPVLIPPLENIAIIDHILSGLDGIIITGGDDISPALYGEQNTGQSLKTSLVRDEAEKYILGKVLESGNPILGICRGFQLINVYFGGKLYQDLETQFRVGINHRNQFMNPEELHHEVRIEDGTMLFEIIRSERCMVNSRHHQGVREPGDGLIPVAFASDGLIEAVENSEMNIVAVQWHPENLFRRGGKYGSIFSDLIIRCEKKKAGN
ncbi:MAG TPA: gamma-glutamyl-gamma-aminobutyrate hydrolase family protein [Spirochaetota bacterium]|nr:gamma-glutamyl-gamma-aminobutyrate hydrolase family protein [Spirochaetota bacterium]HPF06100.1 gamma-glutamyl-gamma-aminobutyrate hydrolase family protein [Spirochaetota bacterium]HPJ42694.1 gamma-glutamyl-gamma-aminobutyrate hydrolase family protein [Spirochaetota bacterium]HPR36933.1 gamma-glutamyl-gamma-aminobutyrate hydrolase family protein [Spirochaetota bacterium]HRX47354.1 gamma-glutamyl-gamma-aminobutyrate hydrolase family protein [Spirochaetota bacterium]